MQPESPAFQEKFKIANAQFLRTATELEALDTAQRAYVLASLVGRHIAQAGNQHQQSDETAKIISEICACIRIAQREISEGIIPPAKSQSH